MVCLVVLILGGVPSLRVTAWVVIDIFTLFFLVISHITLRTHTRCSNLPFPSDLIESSSCLDEGLSKIPNGVLLRESTYY